MQDDDQALSKQMLTCENSRMNPLSLYIHIPWCEKKCPYCDFNSHLAKTEIDEPAYIDTLLSDLRDDLEHFKEALNNRSINTIFIGGGTPSLFSPQSFSRLLSSIRDLVPFADDIEITLEANPGSSEVEKFSGMRAAGINRLSIGIQSFNKDHLKALGRVHSSDEALKAARAARDAGFDNFNLDLMFGLPDQTVQQSLHDLQQAIDLQPAHLSCYQLTIEPNTLFHHQPPVTPDDETLWEMQQALQSKISEHNYHQYEVSAYSQENRQCRHNLNYWQFGDYLGIGAGAHGKVTNHIGSIERYWKIKHPASYIDKAQKVGNREQVDASQISFEFMMNALRLTSGFNISLFEARTYQSIDSVSQILYKHQQGGLMVIENEGFCPTIRGKQLLDSMLQDYLPE